MGVFLYGGSMDAEANVESDAIPGGQLSVDEQKPSEEDLKKLQEAAEKYADEKHSKLDKMKGKAEKDAETARKAASEAKAQLDKVLKERDEEQIRLANDEPDKLKAIQLEKSLRERDAEIERLKAEQEELWEQAGKGTEVTKERTAEKIAEKYGIESEPLLRFTDGSEDKMLELAQILAKNKPAKPDDLNPDDGRGGGVGSEEAQIAAYAKTDSDDHAGIKKILDQYR
jgi:FAD/FMN-containing dehydrogenase